MMESDPSVVPCQLWASAFLSGKWGWHCPPHYSACGSNGRRLLGPEHSGWHAVEPCHKAGPGDRAQRTPGETQSHQGLGESFQTWPGQVGGPAGSKSTFQLSSTVLPRRTVATESCVPTGYRVLRMQGQRRQTQWQLLVIIRRDSALTIQA